MWLYLHLQHVAESPFLIAAPFALLLVTLSAFLAEDFWRYVVHRATHEVPSLWELHKVHHSAEVLTPFTIYRTHPLEGFLMRSGSAFGLSVGAASGAWLLGAPLSTWEVLGVQGLSVIWNVTGSNLRHSHVWLRYPTWLEHLFISPAQHQLHHSQDKQHFDANFGSALSLWDWIFGTLLIVETRPDLRFGLAPAELNHDERVVSALLSPLKHAARRLFPAAIPRELKSVQTTQEFAHPSPPP
jgi:sterol desaturase/sphingolipid hydroxylase (fatty acid hydroxylase superfamily)